MEQIAERRHSWAVTGMDCGSCAARIDTALGRLAGVSDVQVTVMAQRMSLQLDPALTAPEEVEATVRKLGFGVARADQAADRAAPAAPLAEPAWHSTAKGRLVILTGLLLAAAWAVKLSGASETLSELTFAAAGVIGVIPVARRAWGALRGGVPFTIEALMTIAAIGAVIIGAVEEAALVVFLFAVGEVLEGLAASRARAGIRALADVMPKTALRMAKDGTVQQVDAATLAPGEAVLVRPGDRIPADGCITSGRSGVDESPVTGESMPREKGPGDTVHAGTINGDAALSVRVTRAGADNTIARIIAMVEEAEASRAPTERFIDRFARYYMPAVVLAALLVAVLPPLLGGGDWDTWIYRALALLLIGCPCALVISVPASISSALSAGARRGLLIKGGAVIEAMARARHVAFDKTGTLTEGRPVVTDTVALAAPEAELLAIAAAVEGASGHPLARAIVARAEARGITPLPARDARALPGLGAEATIKDRRITVGAPRLAQEMGVLDGAARARAAQLEAAGKTVVVIFDEAAALGLIALRDEPRADATQALGALHGMGMGTVMLTGDNALTAAAIAQGLGTDHRAALMPADKLAEIGRLAESGGVIMVGDGINDAPALAAASVGVAMGSGTDVALETADAAILRNRVHDVVDMLRLSRATMANIHQNVALALGLKAVFLLTTVLGITGLWIAILADTGATVLVTLNALRLLSFGKARGSG